MGDYHLDYEAFDIELLNADFMLALMKERADAGKDYAEANAPVSNLPDDPHRGRYKASFETEVHAFGGADGRRAEGVLWSNDPAALSIEFGHVTSAGNYVEGSYTLTRAMDVMRG